MNLVRTLNVITLSLLLILTGCFGLIDDEDDPIDDAEGQIPSDEGGTTTSASPNQAPVVEGMTTSDIHLEYDTMFICDGNMCNGSVMHSVVDVDGDALTIGWDTDLDGGIDVTLSSNSGVTNLSISQNEFSAFTLDGENLLYNSIALIASDGTIASADLVQLLGYEEPMDDTGPSNNLYVFSAEDANPNADPTTEIDALVRVSMQSVSGDEHDYESGLNWSALRVYIMIDGGAWMTCEDASIAYDDADCTYEKYDDDSGNIHDPYLWQVGEGITITEGNGGDCTASCTVEVNIVEAGADEFDYMVHGFLMATA